MRIVIVDDEADMRVLLRLGAEQHGFDVVGEAADAEAGLVLVRTKRPDVIILDTHLAIPKLPTPGATKHLSTLQAIEFMRSVVPTATVAVFSADSGLAAAACNAGADLFVAKAEGVDTLFQRVLSGRAGTERSGGATG